MSKIKISQTKRKSGAISPLQAPVIMYNALALIFAINTLLSWVECAFSSPTHQNYLRYYMITNSISRSLLYVLVLVFTISIIVLQMAVPKSHSRRLVSYASYLLLFLDVVIITFLISDHFTATNKLALFNLVLAVSFYALALLSYYQQQVITVKTMSLVWLGIMLVSILLGIFLKVGPAALITYAIVTGLCYAWAYLIQIDIQSYIGQIMTASSMLAANLQAIFHSPRSLVKIIRSKLG